LLRYVLQNGWFGVQVVYGDIEKPFFLTKFKPKEITGRKAKGEPLNLRGVQIQSDDVVGAGNREHVGNQLS
jgi:hypothetical protein